MKSDNVKDNKLFRANRLFVDRTEPTSLINELCGQIIDGKILKKYLVFYGYGGIGKSKFFDELKNRIIYNDSFYIVKINLNIYEYNNVMNILLAIRRNLDFDALAFDYAVAQYYKKCGLPFSELKKKFVDVKSSVIDIVKKASKDCAEAIIPGFSQIDNFVQFIPNIKNIYDRIRNKAIYSEIDELDANELVKRIPLYLADAINANDKNCILIFDDYDSMRNKLNGGSLCDNCDAWVLNLLEKIEKGLFLFSSRERINWIGHKKVAEQFSNYYIDRLSDDDVRYFLENVPITDEELINDIIKVSQGVPIYLDMCVDLYADSLSSNEKLFDLSDIDVATITSRYLAHLSDVQNEVVRALSCLDDFDEDIIWYIVKKLNISIDKIQLATLLEKCMFNHLDNDTYKLDATIKKHLLSTNECHIVDNVFNVLLDYLSEEKDVVGTALYSCFESLCELISQKGYVLSGKQIEKLFACTNNLLDFGYWSKLYGLLTHYLPGEHYAPLIEYAHAQMLRREGKLAKSHEIAKELIAKKKWFGCYQYSVELLENQISHLLGNYSVAIKKYKQIVDNMELFMLDTKDKRTYLISKLKYADLLFLKGNFLESLRTLREVDVSGNIDLNIELSRIKGHIMRFNLNHDLSEELYSYAYENCGGDIKGKGALLNNLTDINCISNPEKAVTYAKEALKINNMINAKIEIGKGYASYSVAETRLKNYEKAKELANKSISIQKSTGYVSGELFGYFALAYAYYFEGDIENYKISIEEMRKIVDKTDMYKYVVFFIMALSGDYSYGEDINWLEPIEDKIEVLL